MGCLYVDVDALARRQTGQLSHQSLAARVSSTKPAASRLQWPGAAGEPNCVYSPLPSVTRRRPVFSAKSLNLADNLACPTEGLDHVLALLASPNRKVALLEEVIQGIRPVEVLEQLALHLVLGVPATLVRKPASPSWHGMVGRQAGG
jgi:hypothetical protein